MKQRTACVYGITALGKKLSNLDSMRFDEGSRQARRKHKLRKAVLLPLPLCTRNAHGAALHSPVQITAWRKLYGSHQLSCLQPVIHI